MFTRYWRSYPWALQVALFLLMVFIMISLCQALYFLLPSLTGVSLEQMVSISARSTRKEINAALVAQLISTVFFFLLPSVLFAYVTHPSPISYLGLRKPGKGIQVLLIIVMIAGFTPLILGLEGLMRHVDLGAAIKARQELSDNIFKAYLDMPSFQYFLFGLLVMAIVPAISEELLFRGIVMRFSQKRATTFSTPIFVSALLFALIHADAYGFIPIFVSGVFLGTVYYLTGSLWCSMLAHGLHNGLQVGMMYAARNNPALKTVIDGNAVPYYILVPAAILFAGTYYLLWKNKTPLPANWASDFNDAQKPTNTFSEN